MSHETDRLASALGNSLKQISQEPVNTSAVQRRVLDSIRADDPVPVPTTRRPWGHVVVGGAAVALVVAGTAVVISLMSGDRERGGVVSSDPDATSVTINVGQWEPRDPVRKMRIAGSVQVTDDGCVFLRSESGHEFNIDWPSRWSVEASASRGWQLSSPDGESTIGPGELIVGGGGAHAGDLACSVADGAQALALEGEIEVHPGERVQ